MSPFKWVKNEGVLGKIDRQMDDDALIGELESYGYSDVRRLPDDRWVGLKHFIYTTAIVVGLDSTGYSHRYCYEDRYEARPSLDAWDGSGDPPGNWIKRKGVGGDFGNPAYDPTKAKR